MTDANEQIASTATGETAASEPLPPAPPIESRFLFVDVAAMRAKQLRRGARVRLEDQEAADAAPPAVRPVKSERLAMEEVRRGLVYYEVVAPKSAEA